MNPLLNMIKVAALLLERGENNNFLPRSNPLALASKTGTNYLEVKNLRGWDHATSSLEQSTGIQSVMREVVYVTLTGLEPGTPGSRGSQMNTKTAYLLIAWFN